MIIVACQLSANDWLGISVLNTQSAGKNLRVSDLNQLVLWRLIESLGYSYLQDFWQANSTRSVHSKCDTFSQNSGVFFEVLTGHFF